METTAGPVQLVVATLVAIAVVVVLITWKKVNPFLSLMLGSAALIAVAPAGSWTPSCRGCPEAPCRGPWPGRRALIGLPMFFEIGAVLLIPIVLMAGAAALSVETIISVCGLVFVLLLSLIVT